MSSRVTKQAIEKKLNLLDSVDFDNPVVINGTVTLSNGVIKMTNLPTSNPNVAGQLWSNLGVVTISAG